MKRVRWIVLFVSLYAIFYQLTPQLGVTDEIILIMFFISPLLVIWMGYNILKHGKSSEYTFDERFYDDWDYKRNGREEM
ncbi:MAG: hypothetical protein ABI861_00700 [Panacibacter sp.]